MKAPSKTTPAAPRQTRRKSPAKPPQTTRRTSSLHPNEVRNLLMAAQEAFHHQSAIKRVEPGTTFDEWRRDQVLDAVGLPGISRIDRSHFLTVKAHFLTLAGRDDEAFAALSKTGAKTDHGDETDTRETCAALVARMRQALDDHAKIPADRLQGDRGHINLGWILAAARQRTGKPSLTLETMADRLDPKTLSGILAHVRNHISKREGRSDDAKRQPRTYFKKADIGNFSEDPF